MATTASDVQAQAAVDAWLKSQAVQDMQTSITNAYNSGVAQAQNNYNTALNTLQSQYNNDARSAYINKMETARKLENNLANLGLQNSGYGVTQRLLGDTTYSNNLAALQSALGSNIANLSGKYNDTVANLYDDALTKQYNFDKFIAEKQQDIYDTSVANDLKATYYNYLYNKSGNKSSSGGGGGGSYSGVSLDLGNEQSVTIDDTPKQEAPVSNPAPTTYKDKNTAYKEAIKTYPGLKQYSADDLIKAGVLDVYVTGKMDGSGMYINADRAKSLSASSEWTTNKSTVLTEAKKLYPDAGISLALNDAAIKKLADKNYIDILEKDGKTYYRVIKK